MKTRCPCCGASMSLDSLIAHEGSREVLQLAFKLSAPVGGALLRYLSLFRPNNQELSMNRVAKLLNELLPDIQAQRISRDGVVFPAPIESWLYAIDQALVARDEGRLKTPLKSHGWLYEVMANYRPSTAVITQSISQPVSEKSRSPKSKTLAGLAALEDLKHG